MTETAVAHAIEVEGLSKTYGRVHAVQNLSFSVKRGEIVGFLGPNGAGKSTTIRMITGYMSPTEGRVTIRGIDALGDPIAARRQIGYMPEACPLYRNMRVGEYLDYRADLKGVAPGIRRKRVEKALRDAAVTDVAERIIGQLSKGYRQRVGLADALVADPPILVLDEPTAGLDPNQIRQVRELIRTLAADKTVFLSTHILPEVEALCDRVLIINRGQLVRQGMPDELRGGSGVSFLLRGVGDPSALIEAITSTDGLTASDQGTDEAARDSVDEWTLTVGSPLADERHVGAQIFAMVSDHGLRLHELRPVSTSLEDVFAQLTTKEVDMQIDSEQSQGDAA